MICPIIKQREHGCNVVQRVKNPTRVGIPIEALTLLLAVMSTLSEKGTDPEVRNHASCIASWLEVPKGDNRAIFSAGQ